MSTVFIMLIDEPSLRYNAQLYKGGTIVPMSSGEGIAELLDVFNDVSKTQCSLYL